MQPKCFTNLLVPLDGSRLAEAVLPCASALASQLGASLTLLHVMEEDAKSSIHGDKHLDDPDDACVYLEEHAEQLRETGLRVETHVHDARQGDVARSIVEHSEEFTADLVVLCAHGHGGIRDILYGNIAQQVLQLDERPILLLQPGRAGFAPLFEPHRILVPIDSAHNPDAAISAALSIAFPFDAEIHLVVVVPTMDSLKDERAASGIMLPRTTRAILELNEQGEAEYLQSVCTDMRSDNVPIVRTILRGDTATAVLNHAESINADLVVMSSHGRTGISAIFAGSVTPKVTAKVARPILLVKAEEQQAY